MRDPAEQSRLALGEASAAEQRHRTFPIARRIGRRSRPFGVVRRAARRCLVHLHAAGQGDSRTTSISSAPSKRRRERSACACCSKAIRRRSDPRLPHFLVTPDPGVIEVNVQPACRLGSARRADDDALRRCEARRPLAREVHARRTPHRDRRRQSLRAGRLVAGRQPVPPASRPAAQPDRLLAQSPVAVVPLLGAVSRPDEPGAADRRRAARQPVRDRDRVLALRAAGHPDAALVRRSRAASPAGRRHRQHAPRGVLHRQALLAGPVVGPARPARAAGLRDAARRPHERRAAAAAPCPDRALLARAVHRRSDALGHRAARSVHAAVLHRARLRRRDRGAAARRLRRCRPSGSRRTSSSGFRWPASCRRARFT